MVRVTSSTRRSTVFFVLSKSLDLAVAPLSWIIALLGFGVVLLARGSTRRRLAFGSLVAGTALLCVAGNPMVANRIWWAIEKAAPSTYRADVEYDVVVLLGGLLSSGSADPAGTANYGESVERMLVTYDLLRTDKARSAIISGGAADPAPGVAVEAVVLARQLEDWGIESERLIIEDRAINTRQNATETARLVRERGDRSILVVTSAFHMPRALGCFGAVDLAVDALPVDHRAVPPDSHPWTFAPRSVALDRTSVAVRELAGRLVYRAMGYAR